MINAFVSVPGWIISAARWAAENPMAVILLAVIILASGWLLLIAGYQRRTRRNDQARADDRSKPGAFPRDNR